MNKLLKAVRIARGVSQDELSEHLGLTLVEYLELESNARRMTAPVSLALAAYFGLPVNYFPPRDNSALKQVGDLHQKLMLLQSEKEGPPASLAVTAETEKIRNLLQQQLELREQLTASMEKQLELTEQLLALLELYLFKGKAPLSKKRKQSNLADGV